MKYYLNTRGGVLDYRFLGDSPSESWWREYDPFTKFESPTLIVRSDGQKVDFYLSGIPSVRRDSSQRVIRYTLVAQGQVGEETAELLSLIGVWLDDHGAADRAQRVQEAFDQVFPQSEVEALLSAVPAAGVEERVKEVLTAVSGPLPEIGEPGKSGDNISQGWWGSIKEPMSRSHFLVCLSGILQGNINGAVAFFNLIDNKHEAEQALQAGVIWTLVNGTAKVTSPERLYRSTRSSVVAPNSGNEQSEKKKPTNLLAALFILLVILAMIGLIHRDKKPAPPPQMGQNLRPS